MTNFSDITGHIITGVALGETEDGGTMLTIHTRHAVTRTAHEWRMYHDQDCCECVDLVDGIDALRGLIGNKVVTAEEVSERGENAEYGDTYTWTYYKIATMHGDACLRWYGSSNGYYSESVTFTEVPSGSE